MSNTDSSPFQIRLEVLKLAQTILQSKEDNKLDAAKLASDIIVENNVIEGGKLATNRTISASSVGYNATPFSINSNSVTSNIAETASKQGYDEDDVINTANKLYEFIKNKR